MIAHFADRGQRRLLLDRRRSPHARRAPQGPRGLPHPVGSSSAALGLLRLHALTGEARYEEHALSAIRLVHEIAPRYPQAFGHLLQALAWAIGPAREVAIVGPSPEALLAEVHATYRPRIALAGGAGDVPLLEGREPIDGRATAYVCERFACRLPVTAPADLARELSD